MNTDTQTPQYAQVLARPSQLRAFNLKQEKQTLLLWTSSKNGER